MLSTFTLCAFLLGGAQALPTTGTPTLGKRSTVTYAGVNIAGYDMGCTTDGACPAESVIPPVLGVAGSSVDGVGQMNHFVKDDGLNAFRLPVSWQYLTNWNTAAPTGCDVDKTNFGNYDALVQGCLNSGTGTLCIIDVHNYARWDGKIIGQDFSVSGLNQLWAQIAIKYADQPRVAYGIMNEPHDIDTATWVQTVQDIVTTIRANGSTSQYILMPGNGWTHADTLPSSTAGGGPELALVHNLDGSTDKLIFDVHMYLDVDDSGTHADCTNDVTTTVFPNLATFLRNGGRQAFLSETGGGNTASCVDLLSKELAYLNANSDVFLGFTTWSAGGFATNYILSEVPTESNGVWTDQMLVTEAILPNK